MQIRDNKIKYNKWWSIPSFREKNKSLFNSFEDKIEKQLLQSVKKRLVSDAKMGIFLSGGLDSSLILAMTKKIGLPEDFKSYSLGFKEKTYDETENASFISAYFGVPNQKIIMGHLDFKKIFFDAIIKADNLHSNPAMFANYFLAKNASKDIKVVLSGIGGDELFFGYPTYRADILSEKLSWLPNITVNLLRSLMSNFKNSHEKLSTHYKLKKFLEGLKYDKYKRHYYWRSIFNEKEEQVLAKDLFRNTNSFLPYKSAFNEFLGDDFLEHVAYADLKVWLAKMALYQGDVMTMANSLENRMPFMDYELIELMLSIPRRVKYNGFKNKPLLRNISYKYLPTEFLKIPKSGFHLPLAKWFAGPLKDFVEDILHGNRKITSSILNFKIIEKILEDHFTFKEDNSFKILSLMVFTIWYNNYFIQKNY